MDKIIVATEKKELTDGNKSLHEVGPGVAIFAGYELAARRNFKLNKERSNEQAEQLAIVTAPEALETADITQNGPCTAAIYSDRTITTDRLQNVSNHSSLNGDVR